MPYSKEEHEAWAGSSYLWVLQGQGQEQQGGQASHGAVHSGLRTQTASHHCLHGSWAMRPYAGWWGLGYVGLPPFPSVPL
jgi:hypothetical protein